ncbi:cysteine-rich CWC family protein [Burkholderiaceae bacterium FT117]|uniref:cysteine-rich CWC family protein n=1 Tax=Zeimonas sediminis TaxID=2944268 RepID=UPI0023430F05|nr:cysteine-rich CWC family protein [Zeimonas sediminis]MCM5571674.1 cysteine-rich CWC family protein [Zeimonas sediminis]
MPEPTDADTRCFRCGARFGCGAGTDRCWCTALPSLDPARLAGLSGAAREALGLPNGELPASCLCPACLAAVGDAIAARPDTAS